MKTRVFLYVAAQHFCYCENYIEYKMLETGMVSGYSALQLAGVHLELCLDRGKQNNLSPPEG